MKTVAYLINQYPQASQSFIRREIAAIESLGIRVERFTLRRWDKPLVDAGDLAEQERARAVLEAGALRMMAAVFMTLLTRPAAFFSALAMTLRLARSGERGTFVHLIYLAEACVLLKWLSACGAEHLHAHFGTNSTTVAMLCHRLGGPKFSFTAHGPEEFDKAAAIALGTKLRECEFAVAVCEFGKGQLYRSCNVEDWGKIHVVHCGLDDTFLNSAQQNVPDVPKLVCVGRLCEQKGQMLLVRAAAELRRTGLDFQIVLAGDGPLRCELEKQIDELGVRGHVNITGYLSNAQVKEQILSARALVLPSFAEGLPVVLMEAMALHRPVVSTYVAGIPELVEDGVNGWLTPAGSVPHLTAAIKKTLDAPVAQLQRMGDLGARKVARAHNAREEAARLAQLFAKCCNLQASA